MVNSQFITQFVGAHSVNDTKINCLCPAALSFAHLFSRHIIYLSCNRLVNILTELEGIHQSGIMTEMG